MRSESPEAHLARAHRLSQGGGKVLFLGARAKMSKLRVKARTFPLFSPRYTYTRHEFIIRGRSCRRGNVAVQWHLKAVPPPRIRYAPAGWLKSHSSQIGGLALTKGVHGDGEESNRTVKHVGGRM